LVAKCVVTFGNTTDRWRYVPIGAFKVDRGYALPNNSALRIASMDTIVSHCWRRYVEIVAESRPLMGFAGVVVEKREIQGVCPHVRRLKKAREIERQKERDVWT
jgi:hypothetical protein